VSDRVAATAALWALLVAVWALTLCARGRRPSPGLAVAAGLLELTVLAQAAAAAAAWSGGPGPAAPAEFGPYLAVSVLLGPLAWAYARGASPRAQTGVLAVAAVALAVVCARLAATWRG